MYRHFHFRFCKDVFDWREAPYIDRRVAAMQLYCGGRVLLAEIYYKNLLHIVRQLRVFRSAVHAVDKDYLVSGFLVDEPEQSAHGIPDPGAEPAEN